MKVMLLAAGRSKRMAPIEDKNFINLLGKPLIQHQLEAIVASGLNEIIIVGGAHNLDKLKEISKNLGINADVVEQENLELGMCGAVLAAKKFIKGSPVLVVSSNDVVEKSAFELILKQSDEKLASSFMLAKTVKEYFSGGYLKVDKDNYISEIVEKPENGKEPSNLINIVLHIHYDTEKLIDYLEGVKSKYDDMYEVALTDMIQDGIKFKAVPYEGFWQPVKFPWHIHKVFNFLFDNAEKNVDGSASVADSAVIKGDVIIDENVKIFDGAVVNGPVYIGKNSIVANNALVRDSNVGESCVIGFSTEIARSCLGNNVWTHSNYIGDSVIGNNVSFGAGTITGNLRLDEENIFVNCDDKEPLKKVDTQTNKFGLITGDNIRVGINTAFMPGVKIGGESFVGAGIVVNEDIPKNSFVRGEIKLKISENKKTVDVKKREEFARKARSRHELGNPPAAGALELKNKLKNGN